jgi:hypothetical protein
VRKTSFWGIASFSNSYGEDEVSPKFAACKVSAVGASFAYKWETTSPAAVRVGPSSCDYSALELLQEAAIAMTFKLCRILPYILPMKIVDQQRSIYFSLKIEGGQ